MKKVIVALVVLLSVGIFTNSLLAQKKNFRSGNQNCPRQERLLEALDLTQDQKDALDELRYNHQMEAIELRSKLEQNRLKLGKLFDAENVDEDAAYKIVEENNSIHNQLANSRMEMRIKMNSILTPEQKAELKDRPGFGLGFGNGFRKGGKGFGKGMGMGFGQGNGTGNGYRQGRNPDCPRF